jgi:hypothetical protein
MLSKFREYYLYNIIGEMRSSLNEAVGGGRSREVKAKGKAIHPHDDDKAFITYVKSQVPGVSYSRILMVYYQLLGNRQAIVPIPTEPEGPKNKPFAWITNRTDPDKHGEIEAILHFQGSGSARKVVKVHANIEKMKQRILGSGHKTIDGVLNRSVLSWNKTIKSKLEADPHKFDLKHFSPDYHATQVAEAPDFNKRMLSDHEFAERIATFAVHAASKATGIPVRHKKGFDYETKSAQSRKFQGMSGNDIDDAIQSAIMYLSNQSATEPEKLEDDSWVRTMLSTGARNHVYKLVGSKERASGGAGDHGTNSKLSRMQATKEIQPEYQPEPFKVHPDDAALKGHMGKYDYKRPAPPTFDKPAPSIYHTADDDAQAYSTAFDSSADSDDMKKRDFRHYLANKA